MQSNAPNFSPRRWMEYPGTNMTNTTDVVMFMDKQTGASRTVLTVHVDTILTRSCNQKA